MLERMAKQQEIQLGKKLQDTEKANIEKQRCSSSTLCDFLTLP